MKVLIIEDEIDICYLLSNILTQYHVESEFVNSLSEATRSFQNEAPSIVFLDNHLPDGNGIDYIPYIKINSPSAKIVMITAYDTSSDKNKALSLGADIFIGKPFSKEAIIQAVQQRV